MATTIANSESGLSVRNKLNSLLALQVPVSQFGAVGDGVTDDTAAINSAISQAATVSGNIIFDGSKTYVIRRANPSQQQGGLVLLPGIGGLVGNGCTLLLQDNASFIYGASTPTVTLTLTADSSAGTSTFTVANTTGVVNGMDVMYRLADDTVDANETNYFGFGRIVSHTSNTVTLDVTIPKTTNIAGVTNPNNKTIACFSNMLKNFSIIGFRLITGGAGNPEEGIYLIQCQNIFIEDIYGQNPGAGLINTRFCNNISGEAIVVDGSANFGQGSKGTGINASESLAIYYENVFIKNAVNSAVICEFSAQVTMNVLQISTNVSTNLDILLGSTENSYLTIFDLNVVGSGGYNLIGYGGTTSFCQIRNAYIQCSSDLNIVGNAGVDICGKFYYSVGSNALEFYDFDHPSTVNLTVELLDASSTYYLAQPGLLGNVSYVYTGSNVTAGDLTNLILNLGRRSADLLSGNNGAPLSPAISNQVYITAETIGSVGGAFWTNRALPIAIQAVTSGAGFTGGGKFLSFQFTIYKNLASFSNLPMTDSFALGQNGGNVFASPPAIGSNTPAAGTFTTLYSKTNTQMLGSKVSLIDHTAGQLATISNAPVAGNPTKWVAYDDNGVTRFIPMW